ncbi:MAG: 50S ribosomal protein L4 [Pseudomonadota bacterium]|nr:50S ribosomal protein L4 [Gammaproteobacteria bacterium]MEC8012497.1 50S ribosomal protein L4 [Pseudomonadota bacterium]|tara:strand:+ start:6 stop:611 length:606 start_codon:yes stop_codon:yes gene_type:complete
MNLNTVNGQTLEVSEVAFGREFNEALIHQVVLSFLSNGKQGTKAQKTRADVRGGGKKPWKQKGSGRARAGTRSSPIWRSGGVTFAAKPHVSEQKVNRKMYRAAMASILSELVRQERLVVVDSISIEEPKTKQFKAWLAANSLEGKVFVVQEEITENVYLGARNLVNVALSDVLALDPVTLVNADKVVVEVAALRKIEEMFS